MEREAVAAVLDEIALLLERDGYALNKGMKTCIDPDAHTLAGLHHVSYGVDVARKAWCTRADVLNAWPLEDLLSHLQSRRP